VVQGPTLTIVIGGIEDPEQVVNYTHSRVRKKLLR
jgi:hypothetical protein